MGDATITARTLITAIAIRSIRWSWRWSRTVDSSIPTSALWIVPNGMIGWDGLKAVPYERER